MLIALPPCPTRLPRPSGWKWNACAARHARDDLGARLQRVHPRLERGAELFQFRPVDLAKAALGKFGRAAKGAVPGIGADQRRADQRTADAVGHQIVAQRFGQAAHRELAGGIDPRLRAGQVGSHAGDVDHVTPPAGRFQPGQESDQAVRHTAEIDPHDPVIVGMAGLGRIAEHADPGVVAQHVHLAELRRDLFRRRRPAVAVQHVEPDPQRFLAALLGKPVRGLGAVVLVAIGQRQAHPRVAERLGDPKPQSGNPATDEGHPARPFAHLLFPSRQTLPFC